LILTIHLINLQFIADWSSGTPKEATVVPQAGMDGLGKGAQEAGEAVVIAGKSWSISPQYEPHLSIFLMRVMW
jgi:hypothetical protein